MPSRDAGAAWAVRLSRELGAARHWASACWVSAARSRQPPSICACVPVRSPFSEVGPEGK